MQLDVPAGLEYVDTDDVREMIDALERGLGVFSSGCGGHVFLWKDPTGAFRANHFFKGPPTASHFATAVDAAHYAAGCAI